MHKIIGFSTGDSLNFQWFLNILNLGVAFIYEQIINLFGK